MFGMYVHRRVGKAVRHWSFSGGSEEKRSQIILKKRIDLVNRLVIINFAVRKFQKRKNMANHKATKKDVRQVSKRRARNRYQGKTTRNAIRDLRALTDLTAAGEKLASVISKIDKLAKRGVIHKNKASNLKSALTLKVNALASK